MKDANETNPETVLYRFNRVVFGVSSSRFSLNAVIRYRLQKYQSEDPEFVRDTVEGFFVDDLVRSCRDRDEAFAFYKRPEREC